MVDLWEKISWKNPGQPVLTNGKRPKNKRCLLKVRTVKSQLVAYFNHV